LEEAPLESRELDVVGTFNASDPDVPSTTAANSYHSSSILMLD
jgi:hypothetical protein